MRKHGWIIVIAVALVTAPGWAATRKTTKTTVKAPPKPKMVMKQTAHFTIKSDTSQPFTDAVLALCEASLDGYRDLFGLYFYPNPNPGDKRMVLQVTQGKGWAFQAHWDRKPVERYITIPAMAARTADIDALTVDGLVRGFAYPMAFFDDADFNSGLAEYLSAHVVDYVTEKFDTAKRPRPDNWVQVAGTGKIPSWEKLARPGNSIAAAMLLYKVANMHGKETVGKALRLVAISQDPTWQAGEGYGVHPRRYKVAALCRQLVDLTGDGEIEEWFREAHFPTVLTAVSITPEELWAADYTARCQLLCARWGTNTNGALGENDVQLIYQIAAGDKPKGTAQTPEGVMVTGVDTKGVMVWYQPATKRTYIAGTAKVIPSGIDVTDDALDETGQALGLNKKP